MIVLREWLSCEGDIKGTYYMRKKINLFSYIVGAGFAFFLLSCANSGVAADDGNKISSSSPPSSLETLSSASHFNPAISYGILTDTRDDQTYRTVVIGSQTWMAENANFESHGIQTVRCYRNDSTNCKMYGRLYDWSTAHIACPDGWHLPDSSEWATLETAVGGVSTAGVNLKAASGWNIGEDNIVGTDIYGFSALPGGYSAFDFQKGVNAFLDVGDVGEWWTSTEHDEWYACTRIITFAEAKAISSNSLNNQFSGHSVRCLKNN